MSEFQRWLLDQLNDRNLSAREASLGAGLNHGAVSSYLEGRRPSVEVAPEVEPFSAAEIAALAHQRASPVDRWQIR